jgi:hypothetical protein
MNKRMTISIDEEVYDSVVSRVGKQNVGQFLENLARPIVLPESLDADYAAMATDEEREKQALVWSEALVSDSDHAPW